MPTPRTFSRRRFLRQLSVSTVAPFATALVSSRAGAQGGDAPIDLGGRRELFLDDFLIQRLDGAGLRLHTPQPREVVMVCDAPWEGDLSAYFTLFRDGDRFRMYYRGWHRGRQPVICLAESTDGVRWTRPDLGLIAFNGSAKNNLVFSGPNEGAAHNLTPFKDANPACAPEARYKAVGRLKPPGRSAEGSVLNAFQSPDGLRWTAMPGNPLPLPGAFDSQNLAFWDAERGHYRAYWRSFAGEVRTIATAWSRDFAHWEGITDLTYGDAPAEQLYTNAVEPYFRAPHLYVGFPTRYLPDQSRGVNFGTTEPVFMSSRDGVRFRRWPEAVIPRTAPQDRDGNRSNYQEWGLLQVPGQDRELSVYAREGGYDLGPTRLRRFTYRTDGFVSVHAAARGELVTRSLRFAGRELELNFRTAAAGSLRVEIQDASGRALDGFTAAECAPLQGDEISHVVRWRRREHVGTLAGRAVRLRILLEGADLFALRFRP